MTGAYLDTHKPRNLGVTSLKGTTPNLIFSKFTDFDKQKVYIGVIDLAEPKSGFKLGLLLHCNFDYFCQKTCNNSEKLMGQIVRQLALVS